MGNRVSVTRIPVNLSYRKTGTRRESVIDSVWLVATLVNEAWGFQAVSEVTVRGNPLSDDMDAHSNTA